MRHYFPLDGEYVFKVKLRKQVYDYAIGMGRPQHIDVRVDDQRIGRFTHQAHDLLKIGPQLRDARLYRCCRFARRLAKAEQIDKRHFESLGDRFRFR